MPQKQITQAELRAVLDHYGDAADAAFEIRQRINGGAKVEPGTFSAASDGSTDKNCDRYCGLGLGGLDIQPVSETVPEWVSETPEGKWPIMHDNGLTVHHNGDTFFLDLDE